MKKLIILALTAFMFGQQTVMANTNENAAVPTQQTQSQASLVGTWKDNGSMTRQMLASAGEEFTGGSVKFIFTTNQLSMAINLKGNSDGIGLNIDLKVNFTYTRSGKNLNLKYKNSNITGLNITMTPQMEAALKQAGMTKAQIVNMMKQQMGPSLEEQMGASIGNGLNKLIISQLTSTTLKLTDDSGTVMTMTRVK